MGERGQQSEGGSTSRYSCQGPGCLGTGSLVWAEDQMQVNLYKQGLHITKLISEGHTATQQVSPGAPCLMKVTLNGSQERHPSTKGKR